LRYLRGIGIPAWLVGLLRGALEAAVLAVLLVLIQWLTTADLGDYAALAPLAILGLRAVEGFADNIDPEKQRTP
jgi:hypothetical protein